ncbi:MAG: hypothetical protein NTW10_01670 [Bacteroidetes bacterium]|nr:hypothetical protein [Bacteroidota bacterium]
MKRKFPVFLALILLSGAFFLFSCKEKAASTGTLSITAKNQTGVISSNASFQIYLASSKANLDNHIYSYTNWSDANASTIFRDLTPTFYWYRVEGWEDYGAIEVFSGVDASVILWLNTPSTKKK